MKRNVIILAMLAMPLIGNAQREVGSWTLMPKVGINIAKLTDPDIYVGIDGEKMEYTSKAGLVAGAELEYQLRERFSLSGGLLYSNQGTKMKDNSQFHNSSSTLHYLNIPLTANFYITPDFAFHLGLQPGFALKKHIHEEMLDEHGNWTVDRDGYNAAVKRAAYEAGKRRMVPIFLTTATTAVGVVPMIIAQSSFWMPVGVTIFAGGIGSLILVVTVLPVVYWKVNLK